MRGTVIEAPSVGGRPRDPAIDDAVLRATNALLEEVGYLRLTVAAIAERAGTNKPAIYRRWPTKAHLVHEAVFPIQPPAGGQPEGRTLRDEIRGLVATGIDLLGRPAARSALPGLMAEMTDTPTLHADVIARFADGPWSGLQRRIAAAVAAGEVRADVQPTTVLELIAGSALVATLLRPADQLDASWVDQVVDTIVTGIAA